MADRRSCLWVLLLVNLLAVRAAAADELGRRPAESFDPTVDIRFDQKLGGRLPGDVRVVDDLGNERLLEEHWHSRPVLFALVYYECPMLCDLVVEGMVKCLKLVDLELGEDFDLRVLSIDPQETPQLAAEGRQTFLERLEVEDHDGVRFLVADEAAIQQVCGAVGFQYVYDPVSEEYAHAAGVVVTTDDRILSRYFYGIDYSPRDVRLGLVEASRGKVGSLVDQILLLCLHYDPTTGRYGTVILGSLRLGGVLTVLILGVAIVAMMRRSARGQEV